MGALACALTFMVTGAGATGGGSGSISLNAPAVAYTQDFNTLATSGTTNDLTINGWFLDEQGSSSRNNGQYAADSGTSATGDTYSYGSTGSGERAFGSLQSGTLTPTIGAQFTNDTGQQIAQISVSYVGEQWRFGALGRVADRIDFQVSTDATSLTTGAWTNVDALDFTSPINSGTVGALDGNAPPNRTPISATVPLSVAPGASFWIRWASFDAAPGADDGLAVDDFSLTPIPPDVPLSLSTNDVSADEGNSGTTPFTFTVSLSEPAGAGGVSFDIATADDTATAPGDYQAQSLTGQSIPAGSSSYSFTVDVNGDTNGEPDESFFVNVTNVSGADVQDGQGLGTIINDDVCGLPYTPIYEIQGSGSATPIPGNVSTEGIVVGDFEDGASFRGFYMQDPAGDGDAATSDGIFVFTGGADRASVGQLVRVTGTAGEFSGQTQISAVSSIVDCGSGGVEPTDVTMPFAALDGPERYEGMLVRLPQALVIAEYFNYERFGEMVLGLPLDGESRPFTPTLLEEPGPPAQDRLLQNQLRRITLDDGLNIQNPPLVRHPNGDFFSLANRFRGGDTVANTVGVLGFGFSLYRIQPTQPAQYTAVNERPEEPADVGGRLTVAAFNTLNYFLTLDYPTGNPLDNKCGANQNVECRGADADQPAEFERQRVKLLESLAGLDADVVGLNEMENTPGVDPAGDLVSGLNDMLGAGTHASVDTGVIGPDAIRVGLIYKPGEVMPVGGFEILTSAVDPRFDETLSRPALAQTFEEIASGARFTVVVNHLKSKGSACAGDPDTGDGQGNCNVTRTNAAQALVDWLATDPTGSGDPDFLITGDLNSYAMEDPIDVIKAGADDNAGTADDYTNLISSFLGPFAYSFVFDGMAGYLDHALSNASLTSQVTGVTEWHINADEPDILDYDTSFKPDAQDALFEPNAFRSSDHDPLLVGLDLDTTFAGLCRATRSAVSKEGIANSLCAKLSAAEAADARGNAQAKAGALGAYANELRAQSGKTISAEDAELLIELAGTL
ncbi:MAG: ExeM/NucH family extracellular endonuclease [Gaiellaceae bacterium]